MGLENANISRREALKIIGGSALGLALGGCRGETISPEATRAAALATEAAAKATISASEQSISSIAKETTTPEAIALAEATETPVFKEDAILEYRAEGSLNYPSLVSPDPLREPEFPDVAKGNRDPLAKYELPFEDGDYFEDGKGDIDVPQYYYRVMTAGKIQIPDLNVDLESKDTVGSLSIIINHYGETAMFRDATVDNGFTVAGRVFNMESPEKVTETAQALLDHYIMRMTQNEDGTNCGTIAGCDGVQWNVSIVGNNELQTAFQGAYQGK